MKIKRITPMPLAKLLGAMYAFFGLLAGLFIFILSLFAPSATGGPFGYAVGFLTPIFLTVAYGVMGFVMGYITALVYNFVAKKVGGIELEVETA